MLTWDSTAEARAANEVRGACWLIEWDFSTGVLRSTNAPIDLPALSQTWTRAGNALTIGAMSESEDVSPGRLEVNISVADATALAWAIGDPTVYRKRAIRIYLQLLTETFIPAGAPVRRFTGQMDSVAIERSAATPGNLSQPPGGTIKVMCSRAGLTRSRRQEGLRLTDAQHQHRWPGDNGYKFVAGLIEKPTLWLSKRFQEIA